MTAGELVGEEAASGLSPAGLERRRRRAKRFNERLKLAATLLSNVGIGVFVAGGLAPAVAGASDHPGDSLFAGVVSMVVLHAAAQAALTFWKSEE